MRKIGRKDGKKNKRERRGYRVSLKSKEGKKKREQALPSLKKVFEEEEYAGDEGVKERKEKTLLSSKMNFLRIRVKKFRKKCA